MRLACRLINGDGIGFEYAIVELTPDYVAHLLRLVDEAEKLEKSQDKFYAIELFDHYVEYGSGFHGLDADTEESLDESSGWVQISDDVELEEEPTTAATVAISSNSIHWQAAAKHSDAPVYFETATLTVEELKRMFPQPEEPKTETHRYILYDHDMGNLATTTVYDDYGEAVEDANQLDNVIILLLEFEQQAAVCECQESDTLLSKCPEEARGEQPTSTGKCVFCFSVYFDRDATDPEALGCAFDRLLDTAMSTPGILDEYGNPTIGPIYLGPDSKATVCDCELPGHFNSGVPGILARVENGRLAEDSEVERCDSCERYPTDQAAFDKLVELGMAAQQTMEGQYIQQGGGFCPRCRSDQIEGDSVDFDGPHCTQRMRCLECHTDWFDVYTLSDIQFQD